MKKYVIFDVDGTLNQTELYAVEAYQSVSRKWGKEISREDFLSCIGLSPEVIMEKFFGPQERAALDEWVADIKNQEFESMKTKARPFDGIKETLETLKQEGYHLAVCSNAFVEHIEHVLPAIGVREYFEAMGSLEMGTNKTEVLGNLLKELQADFVCMVGDRRFDLEAARNNKIPMIGCAYGYCPEEIMDSEIVVYSAYDIPAAVHKLVDGEIPCREERGKPGKEL